MRTAFRALRAWFFKVSVLWEEHPQGGHTEFGRGMFRGPKWKRSDEEQDTKRSKSNLRSISNWSTWCSQERVLAVQNQARRYEGCSKGRVGDASGFPPSLSEIKKVLLARAGLGFGHLEVHFVYKKVGMLENEK